jgi:hypothetical protein
MKLAASKVVNCDLNKVMNGFMGLNLSKKLALMVTAAYG